MLCTSKAKFDFAEDLADVVELGRLTRMHCCYMLITHCTYVARYNKLADHREDGHF